MSSIATDSTATLPISGPFSGKPAAYPAVYMANYPLEGNPPCSNAPRLRPRHPLSRCRALRHPSGDTAPSGPAAPAAFTQTERAAILAGAGKAVGDYTFAEKIPAIRATLEANRDAYLQIDDPRSSPGGERGSLRGRTRQALAHKIFGARRADVRLRATRRELGAHDAIAADAERRLRRRDPAGRKRRILAAGRVRADAAVEGRDRLGDGVSRHTPTHWSSTYAPITAAIPIRSTI